MIDLPARPQQTLNLVIRPLAPEQRNQAPTFAEETEKTLRTANLVWTLDEMFDSAVESLRS
jgi:hypothetical protein